MEREWLRKLGLTQSTPVATGARADKVAASILKVAWVPGVQVVSLNVYSTPKLASPLAPALVLAVARPAYFLRHQLKPILPKLSGNGKGTPSYLLVVDLRAKRVLEWYSISSMEGSLYVRRGLEQLQPDRYAEPAAQPSAVPEQVVDLQERRSRPSRENYARARARTCSASC